MLILYHSHCQPPFRAFAHSYKIQNGDDIWANLRRFIQPIYESWRHQKLERTHDWCSAVVTIILSTPDLSSKGQNIVEVKLLITMLYITSNRKRDHIKRLKIKSHISGCFANRIFLSVYIFIDLTINNIKYKAHGNKTVLANLNCIFIFTKIGACSPQSVQHIGIIRITLQ